MMRKIAEENCVITSMFLKRLFPLPVDVTPFKTFTGTKDDKISCRIQTRKYTQGDCSTN